MPRQSFRRTAAEPVSSEQKARQQRIVRAAAKLGAVNGLDGMQMHDVAREAEVAIATLYRYFPSKTHLFTAVLADQLGRMSAQTLDPAPEQDPVDAVADMLIGNSRRLLSNPLLAQAMLQSNQAALAGRLTNDQADRALKDLILRMLGIPDPTPLDRTLVRLLEQCWYGVLLTTLNGTASMEEAEPEIRIACRLLLAPRSNAVEPVDVVDLRPSPGEREGTLRR